MNSIKFEMDEPLPVQLESEIMAEAFDDDDMSDILPPNVEESPKKTVDKRIIRSMLFFRRLFEPRRNESKFRCHKCGQEFGFRMEPNGKRSIRYSSLRQHVITHLKRKLYSCRLCNQEYAHFATVRGHLNRVHSLPPNGNYRDSTNYHEQDIYDMARMCFGQVTAESPRIEQDARSIIFNHFIRLYRNRSNKETRLKCNLCNIELLVISHGGRIQTQSAINHVTIHVAKDLYSCSRCTHRTHTECSMQAHLNAHHHVGVHLGNFTNHLDEHLDEVIEMTERCFGNGNRSVAGGEDEGSSSVEKMNLQTAPSTDVPTKSNECPLQWLNKFTKKGSTKCRLCSKIIEVDQSDGVLNLSLVNHAITHTEERLLFKCKRCVKTFGVTSTIYRHLKFEHNVKKEDIDHRVDISFVMNQNILDALTRCFDWTGRQW